MGFNSIGAPRLGSFKDAVDWHNKVKPIRGNKEGVRPLGERRYHNAASITMPDPLTVVLNYYGHRLVEWRSNDTFILHAPKYYSAFSGDQIIGFVPRSVSFDWNKGRLFVQTDGKQIELTRRQSLKFVPIEKTYIGCPVFEVVDAPDAQVYRVKRGVADNITLRRFGAFLEWVMVTSTIAPSGSHKELSLSYRKFRSALGYSNEFCDAQRSAVSGLAWDEADGRRGYVMQALADVDYLPYSPHRRGATFHRASSELLAAWMSGNNTERWLDALHVIQEHIGTSRAYISHGEEHVDPKRVYDYVKTITAFLHRDEAFKVVTIPAGTVPSKCNAEYFREINIDFGQTD
jgi:hypothetical protein